MAPELICADISVTIIPSPLFPARTARLVCILNSSTIQSRSLLFLLSYSLHRCHYLFSQVLTYCFLFHARNGPLSLHFTPLHSSYSSSLHFASPNPHTSSTGPFHVASVYCVTWRAAHRQPYLTYFRISKTLGTRMSLHVSH